MPVLYCDKKKLLFSFILVLAIGLSAQEKAEYIFRFPAAGIITTGPVSQGGKLWFVSDNRYLFTLDLAGKAIGKRDLGVRSKAFIACDPFGRVVVPEANNGLTMINRAGQAVWSIKLERAIMAPPVFGTDGRIFISMEEEGGTRILCLAQNGRQLWSKSEKGRMTVYPVTRDNGIAFALDDGTIKFLDSSGTLVLEENAGQTALMASNDGQTLILGTGGNSMVIEQNESGFSIREGPKLGTAPLAMEAGKDGFFILGRDGTLYATDRAGILIWKENTGSALESIRVFDRRIIVLGKTLVKSYDLDGNFYRQLELDNASGLAEIGENGAVYSGGKDWILYAYNFEEHLNPAQANEMAIISLEEAEMAARRAETWIPGAFRDEIVMSELIKIKSLLFSAEAGMDERKSLAYLAAVALGILSAPGSGGAVKQGPTPSGAMPRAEACAILGLYGSPVSVRILAEVFARDPDPSVKAAAADAIALIGLDPDGSASRVFMNTTGNYLDERSASSLIDAVTGLYRANGILEDPSGAMALLNISMGTYSSSIKNKALAALKKISASW